jgi:hypothetical protein
LVFLLLLLKKSSRAIIKWGKDKALSASKQYELLC